MKNITTYILRLINFDRYNFKGQTLTMVYIYCRPDLTNYYYLCDLYIKINTRKLFGKRKKFSTLAAIQP